MSNNDQIEIFGRIKMETDMGLFLDDGDIFEWLPKSQIFYDSAAGIGDEVVVEMPEWLAIEKGFV